MQNTAKKDLKKNTQVKFLPITCLVKRLVFSFCLPKEIHSTNGGLVQRNLDLCLSFTLRDGGSSQYVLEAQPECDTKQGL